MVKPRQGHLYQGWDNYDDEMVWKVNHLDGNICEANRKADKKAEQERQARANAKQAERNALVIEMKNQTGQDECIDWSWDDFSQSIGDRLKETEHFQANLYLVGNGVIGFVIKDKKN